MVGFSTVAIFVLVAIVPAFLPLFVPRPPGNNRFGHQAEAVADFTSAITGCFRKYADFKGRAGRSEYWWFFLFFMLALFAIGIAVFRGVTVAGLLFWVVFIPFLAVTARRLHDINRSGWWILIGYPVSLGMISLLYMLVQPPSKIDEKMIRVFD